MSLPEVLREKEGWVPALRLAALRGGVLGLGVGGWAGIFQPALGAAWLGGLLLALGPPALVESWACQRRWDPFAVFFVVFFVAIGALLAGIAQAHYTLLALTLGPDPSAVATQLRPYLNNLTALGGFLLAAYGLPFALLGVLRQNEAPANPIVGGAFLVGLVSVSLVGSDMPGPLNVALGLLSFASALTALLAIHYAFCDWLEGALLVLLGTPPAAPGEGPTNPPPRADD